MSTRRRRIEKATEFTPIMRLWLLRLLVPIGAQRQFVSHVGFNDDKTAELLGLQEWVGTNPRDFDLKLVRAALRKLHESAEVELHGSPIPKILQGNIARVAKLVNLSDTDCRILEFAVMVRCEPTLENMCSELGSLSAVRMFQALSILLDVAEPEIRDALSSHGILAKSGLVSLERQVSATLNDALELLSGTFADQIYNSAADPINLLRDTVALSAPAELEITDYTHVAPTLDILRPYLKQAIASKRKGVNIFLYGDPGTGKSQLAKVIAQELGCELFEVASEDNDGDAVDGARRLRAFRVAQSFFAQRRVLFVFDEVEDVFDDGDSFFGRKSTAQTCKAWINRTLEENPVPTLWLSNSVKGMDPAFIRRFDMVFELPVPPKKQRTRILDEICSDLVDAPVLARIAESAELAPAVVAKAATVLRSISAEIDSDTTASAFELLIGNTLQAQGHSAIRKNDPNRLPDFYDPSFIHADADLAHIAAGLTASKSGRLCLYGPPGTGKTAYGRWLAEQLDMPLLVKRASDLMSMYVGQNEKNIALAFQEAANDGALLLIDEVDGFLQDRKGAQRGWEVSLVNEMLAQMESFPGVFIASTNLMDGLDTAALRRFDLKVKFDFLKPEQACELLRRHCETLNLPAPQLEQLARVRRLPKLTLGDFALVLRQHRFRAIGSSGDFVTALSAECAVKQPSRAPIGFLHNFVAH